MKPDGRRAPRMIRDDPERRRKIAAEVATGEVSLQTVGDRYGISRERVRQIAASEGITVRGGFAAQMERTRSRNKVIAQASLTMTDREIADQYGISTYTVRGARRQWGIDRSVMMGRRERGDYHGTLNGYQFHKCRCELCREACHRQRQSYKEKGRLGNPPNHGNSGYLNYYCRCTICKSENSEYQRLMRDRRKARRGQAEGTRA